jgi:hypothetical protein
MALSVVKVEMHPAVPLSESFFMRRFLVLFVVLAGLGITGLHAEDVLTFPRLRTLQDMVQRTRDSRYRDDTGLLGQDAFSAGFSVGYISDYYWRGFKLFDGDLLTRGDAYVNIYGFEASVWGMWDFGREQIRPTEVDYRFRYQFELEGALLSVGYTYYDFSGSDGSIGRRDQGFGDKPLKDFPDDKMSPGVHELQLSMTYFTSVIQSEGANLRYTLNYFQRLDDEGSRFESTLSFFVDSPQFTVFGDYFEITTTTVYQHRYLTNESHFQGQTFSARLIYNLHKYGLFPLFFQLEAHYYLAFEKDYVDGFFFGGSVNFRF